MDAGSLALLARGRRATIEGAMLSTLGIKPTSNFGMAANAERMDSVQGFSRLLMGLSHPAQFVASAREIDQFRDWPKPPTLERSWLAALADDDATRLDWRTRTLRHSLEGVGVRWGEGGGDPDARRAVLVGPGAGRARSAGVGEGSWLAIHQPASGAALGAVAAGAQALRAPAPQPRAGRRARPGAGLFAGLNVLPKTWRLTTYSYRTSRSQQVAFFEALQPRLTAAGLIGDAGVNLDFHAIMSYGEQETVLEKHYVPRRSQRTRSVLTFIAQDGQEHTILYANAELTARQQPGEVTDFCRFYERTHGQLPKLLVFDSKLTTNEHLAELDHMGVGFITLRQRYPKLIQSLEQLPASAWTKTRLDRSGKHKTATYHEDPVTIKGSVFRQLAVRLGRDQPTLILTNQQKLTPKQLIERYGQRWGIENQLAEQIRAFHLDSLCSQVPLAVDFDIALTILADVVYRRFARGLHTAYRNQTPDTIRDYLIDGIGELRLTPGHIEVALRRRTHTPALLEAAYPERRIEVPWWGGRTLSYSFPAR